LGGGCPSTTAVRWLGILYALVPTLLFMVALYFAWTYPLTRARHARLEQALRRRQARAVARARAR